MRQISALREQIVSNRTHHYSLAPAADANFWPPGRPAAIDPRESAKVLGHGRPILIGWSGRGDRHSWNAPPTLAWPCAGVDNLVGTVRRQRLPSICRPNMTGLRGVTCPGDRTHGGGNGEDRAWRPPRRAAFLPSLCRGPLWLLKRRLQHELLRSVPVWWGQLAALLESMRTASSVVEAWRVWKAGHGPFISKRGSERATYRYRPVVEMTRVRSSPPMKSRTHGELGFTGR